MSKVTVVSTGFKAPTKQRCLDSIASQKGVDLEHIYIEASEQDPVKSGFQNCYESVMKLPKDNIVCLVDGDDWLAHNDVLAYVASIYDDPEVWMTYGSFQYADGRPGFAAKVEGNPRTSQWCATHMKTFRAALFQKLRFYDFNELAWDIKVMVPLLEMAGEKHSRFLEKILYIYNFASSYEFNADNAHLLALRDAGGRVKLQKPYKALESL